MNKIIQRHNQIDFDEPNHIYTLKGSDTVFTSVTTFIGKFHEKFDAKKISEKLAGDDEIKKAKLLKEWQNSGPHGTYIHRLLELFAENHKGNYVEAFQEHQFNQGIKLLAQLKDEGWTVFKAEIILWLQEKGLCGTCDLLLKNDKGQLLIADWKTCKDIPTKSYGKKFYSPLDSLDCSKHNKYALQMSVYQYMIESITDCEIVGRRLLWVPQNGEGKQIPTDYLEKEVEIIINGK